MFVKIFVCFDLFVWLIYMFFYIKRFNLWFGVEDIYFFLKYLIFFIGVYKIVLIVFIVEYSLLIFIYYLLFRLCIGLLVGRLIKNVWYLNKNKFI